MKTTQEIQERFKQLGLTWPTQSHVVAIRSNADVPDAFDDWAYSYLTPSLKVYPITTNPGTHWLQTFINPVFGGAAVLASDHQYINCWKKGLHFGKPALVQVKPVLIFRDNNKNLKSEEIGTPVWGLFGINQHRAGKKSVINFNWSAGCQVWANETEYEEYYKDCPDVLYSYTLLKEW